MEHLSICMTAFFSFLFFFFTFFFFFPTSTRLDPRNQVRTNFEVFHVSPTNSAMAERQRQCGSPHLESLIFVTDKNLYIMFLMKTNTDP
jgi:hypothetical protein